MIAVICAYNPRNCGMYSVDLAAENFLQALNCDYSLFIAQTKWKRFGRYGKLRFQELSSHRALDKFSTVLYWGDFLNNPTYGLLDFSNRHINYGYAKNTAQAVEDWLKFFLLKGYKRHQRVISVSNNFQSIATSFDHIDPTLVSDLYQTQFDYIFPRDSASTAILKEFCPTAANGNIQQGIDAAFLLNQAEIYPALNDISPTNTFAYFFHRSQLQEVDKLVHRIWQETGCKPVPIQRWLNMSNLNPDKTYREALYTMKRAKFVISDTYHCLANAMNLEVPVIGVGRVSNHQIDAGSDFKKKILFQDFGLAPYYFEVEGEVVDANSAQSITEKIQLLLHKNWTAENYQVLMEKKFKYRQDLTKILHF